MAGTPGNPNHDTKTGRFTSASGLNKSNSTKWERGKARINEHYTAGKVFAAAAAGAAVTGVGMAVLQGVTKPVRIHSSILANQAINAGIGHTERLVAAHGPKIVDAIKAHGSTLINHVKNMKIAGAIQHQAPYTPGPSSVSSISSTVKPRVRVPMGRQVVTSTPKRASAPRRRK